MLVQGQKTAHDMAEQVEDINEELALLEAVSTPAFGYVLKCWTVLLHLSFCIRCTQYLSEVVVVCPKQHASNMRYPAPVSILAWTSQTVLVYCIHVHHMHFARWCTYLTIGLVSISGTMHAGA